MSIITKIFSLALAAVFLVVERALKAAGLPGYASTVCWNSPLTSGQFADLLDIRFQDIFKNTLPEPNDMLPLLYNMVGTNGRNDMRWSNVGEMEDWGEFTGSIDYGDFSQGYDVTLAPIEFAKGIQIERKLFDDEQYNIIDSRPEQLVEAYKRRRQKDAARVFLNAFSVDSYFYNHSEGVALCSDSHTTTSGASTANGFDNKMTAAFSATALAAAFIQMQGLRGDVAQVLDIMPDEIWYPTALYEQVFEAVKSMGKVDTANNNKNVHEGAYDMYRWNRLSDTNDWFVCNKAMRKKNLFWSDRIGVEFAMVEDFDTLVAKWRGYCRYGAAHNDWRWVIGSQVG
jgi:hypothetical protein